MKLRSGLRTSLANKSIVNRQSRKKAEKRKTQKRPKENRIIIVLNRRQVRQLQQENQNRIQNLQNLNQLFVNVPPLPNDDLNELNEPIENQPNNIATTNRKMDYIKRVEELKLDGNLCENWRRFKRNYDIFSTAAGIDEKQDKIKINTLLNAVGPEAVEIFDTFELTEQERASYERVVAKFEEFCKPRKNTVYERYVFYQRTQHEGESFDVFLMEIKRLVRTCEFGATENEMLRDRIVMGVVDKKLQKRLLETATLTYDTAVEKARTNEATAQQSEGMNKHVAVNEVQPSTSAHTQSNERYNNNNNNKSKQGKFKGRRQQQQQQPQQQQQQRGNNNNNNNRSQQNNTQAKMINNCNRCGHTHKIRECLAYGKQCRSCSKLNHFSSMCKTRNVAAINANDDVSQDQSEFYVNVIEEEQNAVSYPWTEKIKINGKDVTFKIDTGAEIDVLPMNVVERLGHTEIKETGITLRAFGGHRLKPTGMCSLLSTFNGIKLKINHAVVDKNFMPILGLKSCIRFGIVRPGQVNRNSL